MSQNTNTQKPVVLVDLDGTMATFTEYKQGQIGTPIWSIVDLVKYKLMSGFVVKIFTARADNEADVKAIQKWLVEQCKLPALEVTNQKDFSVVEIYDDRAYHVEPNTGVVIWTGAPGSESLQNAKRPATHLPRIQKFKGVLH